MDPHPTRSPQYQYHSKEFTNNSDNPNNESSVETKAIHAAHLKYTQAAPPLPPRSMAIAYHNHRQTHLHYPTMPSSSSTSFSASASASILLSPALSPSLPPMPPPTMTSPSTTTRSALQQPLHTNLRDSAVVGTDTNPMSNAQPPTPPLDTATSTIGAWTATAASATAASDLVQHCLLFPTYATRHSQSGSKDPLDWNIRVRGWAFSKRSNRRKRLVMSVARKIAGVTKDNNKVYETLESRFGMFLASNTQGAQFAVQCVGLASTTHMELAGGDTETEDPIVDVLIDELKSSDGAMAEAEVIQDKELFRKSLELDRGDLLETLLGNEQKQQHRRKQQQEYKQAKQGNQEHVDESKTAAVVPLQHAAVTALKSPSTELIQRALDGQVAEQRRQQEDAKQIRQLLESSDQEQSDHQDLNNTADKEYTSAGAEEEDGRPKYTSDSEISPSRFTSTEGDATFTGRLSKGAAILKGAIRKYKPSVMSQASNNASVDSLKIPSYHPQTIQSGARSSSNVSDESADESNKPVGVNRAGSGDSAFSQSTTQYEDLGQGRFPTVQTSSRPGGHFGGTLRMSHEEVEAHRRQQRKDTEGGSAGHPRFLKLHAHHSEMQTPSHGIVNLIDPEGISIISDIDDTIKETNVTAGTRIILRNTFLKEMQEVEGMANVYRKWWNKGAAVHYVSNSPWQLIPSLLEFFHTHMFPPGSAHLRLHDSMLKTYFMVPGESKRRAISEILLDFPDRKFILVGDSGEIDMEIYTEMAIAYPDQIFRIFIRDISTARLREMVSKTPPPRSRSFSSMLLPKAPITAVTTGFGLFGRRGSNANTPGITNNSSPSLLSLSGMSSTMNVSEGLDSEDEELEIPTSSSPAELSDEEILATSEKARSNSEHSFSPKLEPSSPLAVPVAIPFSRSPASSPRLQPAKHISSGVKAVANSILSSTFRRSPNNNNNHMGGISINKKNGTSGGGFGWNAIRSRAGSMSPSSPLAMDSTSTINGYPFPRVGSATASSISTAASQQNSAFGSDSHFSDDQEEDGHGSHDTATLKDIFEDHDHQHVVLQQQQQQASSAQSGSHSAKRRPRTNTFSFSFSSSFPGSTPTTTPSVGHTPAHSPPVSPRIPIRGVRGVTSPGSGLGSANGHTSSTMLATSLSATSITTAVAYATTTAAATCTTFTSTSPGAMVGMVPMSTSPSMLSSSATSVSSTSFSITKNPLEIWLERVDQCRRRLPEGVTLTLFESAEELDHCEIVREMFERYDMNEEKEERKEEEKESRKQESDSDSASLASEEEQKSSSCADSISSVESCRGADKTLIHFKESKAVVV